MTGVDAIPGVRDLWRHGVGDPAVTVGVIEGPPDRTHPCLRGADLTVLEPSWLPDTPVHSLAEEHGTFVTSILFGQHGSPVPGLAPRCRGVVVPALRDTTSMVDPLNAARAIDVLVRAGAHVIQCTVAHPTRSGAVPPVLAAAVRDARDSGVLVVAPAGNEYGENQAVPGMPPEVLVVGAHRADGTMLRYGNWGPALPGHGIVAPSGDLRAAVPGGGTTTHEGTSIASPVVTGVAALLLSLRHRQGAPLDPVAVGDALLRSAQPCASHQAHDAPERCLSRTLDIAGATRLVLGETPGAAGAPGQLVYALGRVGHDPGEQAGPDGLWTFHVGHAPGYVLRAAGAFARDIDRLLLLAALDAGAICVPGRLSGHEATLAGGQAVPVVEVEHPHGLRRWPLEARFDRLVHEVRNPGVAARDRALNFAAVTAAPHLVAEARGLTLRQVEAVRQPHHPHRDCWGVTFRFADPENVRHANWVCLVTVDVSDVVPLSVGRPRAWSDYPHTSRATP